MWLLISQRNMLNGGSQTDPGHKGPLCHVALLKHPAPMGDHLDSPPQLPTASVILIPSALPHLIARTKKSILNKVETGFPLHPRKAHFRARLNTLKPQGNDEIKHQRHALYVSQEKNNKKKKTLAVFITSGHLGFYTRMSAGHSSTH